MERMNIEETVGRFEVINSPIKEGKRECEEQFIDRVLGIPKTTRRTFRFDRETGRVEGKVGEGLRFSRELPKFRQEALKAVLGVFEKQEVEEHQKNDGVSLLLSDPDLREFLLTRKDHLHPNPACRERYSLLGGSRDPHESFEGTLAREVCEEIGDLSMIDEIGEQILYLRAVVPCVQWPGSYRCETGIAVAKNESQFRRWSELWMRKPSVVLEGNPAHVSRADLDSWIQTESRTPGGMFVASHGVLIQQLLFRLES